MPLQAGTQVGAFQIDAQIGEGGMGRVYRARDSTLNRDVALKVLPDEFAADPDRLARFRREAQILAALNHPNIAAIYGFVESGTTHALAMELVEGEDLSKLIARGTVPLGDALPIAKQIADALETAHEQGIVHRDLKPANIKIRADGSVKVLDFGLAKALDPGAASTADLANSPTITAHATRAGLILGTAAYMAPEQARGKAVDKRADIWAFGCVLFEMLAGRRAFDGDDVSTTLAVVLTANPPWSALPATTPPNIQRLLHRCLERDPRRRMRDVGDARFEIEDALAGAAEMPSTSPRTRGRRWREALPWSIVAVMGIAALGATLYMTSRSRPAVDRSVTKVLLDVQPAERLTGSMLSTRPSRTAIAFSPDGRTIVFSGIRGKSHSCSNAPWTTTKPRRSPALNVPSGRSSTRAATLWVFGRTAS
jgi:serine/threonine protein kinase